MNHFQCQFPDCKKKDALVFHCNYCGNYFCADHHLPENHNCSNMPEKPPFHVRPPEVKSHEPNEPLLSANQHSETEGWKKIIGMKIWHKAVLTIGIAIIVLSCFLLILGAIAPSPTPSPTPMPTVSTPNTLPTPDYTSPTSTPTATPPISTFYVEVDYQTVGWFYSSAGNMLDSNYNYTFLVLNVTITNHGYSQINVIGDNGFSLLVNNEEYTPLISLPNSMYNGSTTSFYDMQKSYSFASKLPSEAILLDTGSVNGTIVFKFGNPNVYPQQPQILNKPFVLQYSVSYGDSVPLWKRQIIQSGPYAQVVINQIG